MITEILLKLIAPFWTIIIILHLVTDYLRCKDFDWFILRGRKASFICYIFTHISIGVSMWSLGYYPLSLEHYFFMLFIGVGFAILGHLFWRISHKDLERRLNRREKVFR